MNRPYYVQHLQQQPVTGTSLTNNVSVSVYGAVIMTTAITRLHQGQFWTGDRSMAPTQRYGLPLAPKQNFCWIYLDIQDENLVITCWLYVKKCIFGHIIRGAKTAAKVHPNHKFKKQCSTSNSMQVTSVNKSLQAIDCTVISDWIKSTGKQAIES